MADETKFDVADIKLRYHFGGDKNRWLAAADEIATYENYLRAVPIDELRRLANEEVAFNEGQPDADFDAWLAKDHWELEQAITLSLGRDPEYVVWHSIQEFPDRSALAIQFRRRRELVLRAVAAGELWDPVTPRFFVSWTRRIGLLVPSDLRDSYDANFSEPFYAPLTSILAGRPTLADALADKDQTIFQLRSELKTLRSRIKAGIPTGPKADDDLRTRQKHTLLKLIFGVAVQKYRYDSAVSRSDAVRRIANDLEHAEVPLDDDTIRHWLQEAAEYVLSQKKRRPA